jgi:hypothetical protein
MKPILDKDKYLSFSPSGNLLKNLMQKSDINPWYRLKHSKANSTSKKHRRIMFASLFKGEKEHDLHQHTKLNWWIN